MDLESAERGTVGCVAQWGVGSSGKAWSVERGAWERGNVHSPLRLHLGADGGFAPRADCCRLIRNGSGLVRQWQWGPAR